MSTTTTRERPFNVSAWEVRAIRDGRKTQTRRVIDRVATHGRIRQFQQSTTPGYDWQFRCRRGLWQDYRDRDLLKLCLFGQPGDALWLRETYGEVRFCGIHDGDLHESVLVYKADNPERKPLAWRPSTQMPRWASRETLRIKSVRIERLQEISEADALAEGIVLKGVDCRPGWAYREMYQDHWRSTNSLDSWDANPFVWVIEHERVK